MFTNQMIMHLYITPGRLISDIQNEFNQSFPFLKLEFFTNKSLSRPGFPAKQLIPSTKPVDENQPGFREGCIDIEDDMKVNELERTFREKCNLAVQVLRKSGNLWLETSMTDNWSLGQQNNHGRELSTGKK